MEEAKAMAATVWVLQEILNKAVQTTEHGLWPQQVTLFQAYLE